jgi:hypothetical protein
LKYISAVASANSSGVPAYPLMSNSALVHAWSGYTTSERFVHDPGRLADVRAIAERLADARDSLTPPES